MGRSKRRYNIAQIEKNSELVSEVRKDCNRNLAFIPSGYISMTDALRKPYSLTEKDLESLRSLAVYGDKRGQQGIFYPPGEVRALSTAKKSSQDITENMISEATLVKQLPKILLDLKSLRPLGVKGSKPGHKGRQTTYYTIGDVQETLGLKVLENDATEGINYIRERCVPIELKLDLRLPTTCIWLHTNQRAEPCYLQPEVEIILNHGGFCEPKMRRSDRVKKRNRIGAQNLEHDRIEHLSHAYTGIEQHSLADTTGVELAGVELAGIEDQTGTEYQNSELAEIEHNSPGLEYQILD